jgi:hypothetical protein
LPWRWPRAGRGNAAVGTCMLLPSRCCCRRRPRPWPKRCAHGTPASPLRRLAGLSEKMTARLKVADASRPPGGGFASPMW